MNYDEMTLDELKDYARSIGVTFSGNIGKAKLIARIQEKNAASVINDTDLDEVPETYATTDSVITDDSVEVTENTEKKSTSSLLQSITSAIDELDETSEDEDSTIVDLPMDTVINVKSITFGGLTYKSRSTGAVFRWNSIGAVQPMTVQELNEMNNYKSAFLRKPLVILLDERAVNKFRLTPVYENVAKINNLTKVFNSDMATIERTIDDALRVNMRDVLISKVRQMYKNRKLTDINIIRLLEKKLQFDLSDDE